MLVTPPRVQKELVNTEVLNCTFFSSSCFRSLGNCLSLRELECGLPRTVHARDPECVCVRVQACQCYEPC